MVTINEKDIGRQVPCVAEKTPTKSKPSSMGGSPMAHKFKLKVVIMTATYNNGSILL